MVQKKWLLLFIFVLIIIQSYQIVACPCPMQMSGREQTCPCTNDDGELTPSSLTDDKLEFPYGWDLNEEVLEAAVKNEKAFQRIAAKDIPDKYLMEGVDKLSDTQRGDLTKDQIAFFQKIQTLLVMYQNITLKTCK